MYQRSLRHKGRRPARETAMIHGRRSNPGLFPAGDVPVTGVSVVGRLLVFRAISVVAGTGRAGVRFSRVNRYICRPVSFSSEYRIRSPEIPHITWLAFVSGRLVYVPVPIS
jgi:hypothetical protein